ncbi:uncharacterized protein LOC131624160 [Vicia villosa]|uniref:uncharacterized protein LOC131624160 n=1 Tax=Vicia villosa TaxID=3911 RepID=UPI00273B2893|nr:uncharacterized protein LOC131624160 [Vicia villosa]
MMIKDLVLLFLLRTKAKEDSSEKEKSLDLFLKIGLDERTARNTIANNKVTTNLTAVIHEAGVTDGCSRSVGNLIYTVSYNEAEVVVIGFWSGFAWLAGMTVLIAILSEYVVDTIEDASDSWSLSVSFLSIILLPIVGKNLYYSVTQFHT